MGVLVLLAAVLAAVRGALSHQPWMVFFQDDFFYYLKIAQNLAHGRGSTFNGIVPTNGYHPLWLLALTGLSLVTTSGRVIFWSVVATAMLSTMATFFLAARVLRQTGASLLLRQGLAAYVAIYALHVFYTGMEVILAVPLMFAVMAMLGGATDWRRGFAPSCALGVAVSAMVLARLDLLLFAGLLLLFALGTREMRASMGREQIAGVALGLVPLFAYFLSNRVLFGTWLPISGIAKQLKFTHLPSLRPWATFYGHNVNSWMNLLPIHLALLLLPFVWRRLSARQRVVLPSALLFPFVYVLLLSCASDWRLWLWYLYPLRAALCASFAVFCLWPPVAGLLRRPAFAVVVLLVVAGETAKSKWWTDAQPPMYAAAVDVEAFARTHPGVYAMGDRSGMIGYLLPDPVVQTEGLVMDRTYLDRIRRQEPLLPALDDLHVRYYIGTAWAPFTGCFHAVEPFQAGPTSAHMVGDLCQPPVASFQHEMYQTVIFDLQKEQASASAGRTLPAR